MVDLVGQRQPVPVTPAGQEHHELVATCPVDGSLACDSLLQALGDLLDVLVARRVAVRVVDLLEAVEVDRHQRQHCTARGAARDRLGEVVVKAAMVAESRQAVRSRLLLELLDAGVGAVSRSASGSGGEQEPRAGQHRDRDCAARPGEHAVGRADSLNLITGLGCEREDDDSQVPPPPQSRVANGFPARKDHAARSLLVRLRLRANPPDRGFMSKTSVTLSR